MQADFAYTLKLKASKTKTVEFGNREADEIANEPIYLVLHVHCSSSHYDTAQKEITSQID